MRRTITTKHSTSADATKELARKAATHLKHNLILLFGTLGAGKTTFVKGFAEGLGIKDIVQSPTFVFERRYKGTKQLVHFDLYRNADADFLIMQEINDALAHKENIVVIEWPQTIINFLPQARVEIYFRHVDETTRILEYHLPHDTNDRS